ncbi:hypothetical protein HMPREF1545_00409, partial [Oscillibacter sp. KLE 1728]
LIYKVHAVPGGEIYFTTKFLLCQHIFSSFFLKLCVLVFHSHARQLS